MAAPVMPCSIRATEGRCPGSGSRSSARRQWNLQTSGQGAVVIARPLGCQYLEFAYHPADFFQAEQQGLYSSFVDAVALGFSRLQAGERFSLRLMEAVPDLLIRPLGLVLLDHLRQGHQQFAKRRVRFADVRHYRFVVLWAELVSASADDPLDDDQAVPESFHFLGELVNGRALAQLVAEAYLARRRIRRFQVSDHETPRFAPLLALLLAQLAA